MSSVAGVLTAKSVMTHEDRDAVRRQVHREVDAVMDRAELVMGTGTFGVEVLIQSGRMATVRQKFEETKKLG